MGRIFQKQDKWWIDYRVNGKRHRKKIGTKAEAEAALSEMESRIARAGLGAIDNRYSLDELIVEVMRRKKLELESSTIKSYGDLVANLQKGGFRRRRIDTIRLEDAEVYCEKRLAEDGVSTRRVNMEIGLLKHILKLGVERGRIATNPLAAWRDLKGEPTKVRRAMTPQQVQRFLDASMPREYPLWLCYVTTAMRREEVVDLQWENVDLEAAELRLEVKDTKNDDVKVIPLHPTLLVELRKLNLAAKPKQGNVFLNRQGRPYKNNLIRSFRRTLRRAGFKGEELKHFDIQSLRVTGATQLMREGVHPKVVQRITGHKNIKVLLDIYTKVNNDDCRKAISKLPYGKASGTGVGTKPKKLSQGVAG